MIRHEYKPLIKLGLPILAGQLGSVVTGFVDNIMVGHYSTEALASASFVNNTFNVAFLTLLGFTYGVTPLVGTLFARGEKKDIGKIVRNALAINTWFAIAVAILMTILYFNVDRLGQPEELLPLIRPYYLTALSALVPMALFNVMAQWSYGINNTAMPTWIILGYNTLNIVGNYAFIFGKFGCPEMGLLGAGISTLASRTLGTVIILIVFFAAGSNSVYRQGYKSGRLNRRQLSRLWTTSLPVSLQMACETGAFSVSAIMCGMLGKIELAAFQIIVVIGMLGFCIYYAVGAAVAVRVSQKAGVGDARGMRRTAWAGYHILLVIMCCSSLLFAFFGRDLIGIFTNDQAVIALAASTIFPLVLYQSADATQVSFANALRGTTRVQPMMWIAVFSYVIVGLPATWALCFPAGLGIYGVVLSFSVSLGLAAVLYLLYFLRATKTV